MKKQEQEKLKDKDLIYHYINLIKEIREVCGVKKEEVKEEKEVKQ